MSGINQKDGKLSNSDETTATKKRRKRSISEKQRIIEASFKPGASVRALAEAHGLHPTQLYKWRRRYGRKLEGKSGAALLPVHVADESEHSQPARKASKKPETPALAIIHLEFGHARVRIESADCATVLAVVERLAR
jgi:transposase